MPYINPFIRLTFSGSIAGEDTWSNGFNITSIIAGMESAELMFDALDPADLTTVANSFYLVGSGSMSKYNKLNEIKMALIDVDGSTVGEPKYYTYLSPGAGNFSDNVTPQDSVVLSLTTVKARGLAYRGRVYLPSGFASSDAVTARISSAAVSGLLARSKNFLDGINSWATPGSGRLTVNSAVRTGAGNVVTGIEIGNLVDTQRRRRNKLAEVYASGVLA